MLQFFEVVTCLVLNTKNIVRDILHISQHADHSKKMKTTKLHRNGTTIIKTPEEVEYAHTTLIRAAWRVAQYSRIVRLVGECRAERATAGTQRL